MKRFLLLLCSLVPFAQTSSYGKEPLVVGSKIFTESYILAEIIAQIAEKEGEAEVIRKFGLGGTGIVFQAMVSGKIDIYPEYTGTISETILKNSSLREVNAIRSSLEMQGLTISESLGFNNTYALAVRRDFSQKNRISKISDLRKTENVIAGLSHEFVRREDGYPGLTKAYGFTFQRVRSISHSLAYEAIQQGKIDLTDIYSTDAKIGKFDLLVLEDDKKFFPEYLAVLLARSDIKKRFPKTWLALSKMEASLDEQTMIRLNAMIDIEKHSFADAAATYLTGQETRDAADTAFARLLRRTAQHSYLVGVSLLLAVLVGLPIGYLAVMHPALGHIILTLSGIFQTIPSLALLCFLIPIFGIGTPPALTALFLYGLFPIVTGIYSGIKNIDPKLIESADALALTRIQKILWIEVPLASRNIIAGIKTSAIIGIGTATLAALIGAGGFGAPIVTGLAINDIPTILFGAIPAAIMALLTHFLFEMVERIFIPKGLR